jgi:hypothetical protein
MAERYDERMQELLLMRRELATIEAHTAAMKHDISAMGEQAREHAWVIAEHGLTIGEKGNQLFTGGAADWEAPKVHPVWGPEVAREARTLERMGEATFMYEPLYQQLDAWAQGNGVSYAALDGMQDDRLEYAHDYGMDQLHDRLDALQQARQQEQSQRREQGMGY